MSRSTRTPGPAVSHNTATTPHGHLALPLTVHACSTNALAAATLPTRRVNTNNLEPQYRTPLPLRLRLLLHDDLRKLA